MLLRVMKRVMLSSRSFRNIFKGLRTLGDEYVIKLKEGSQPYSLFTPRNIPIPLKPKVKTELDRMQSLGVTSPIHKRRPQVSFESALTSNP